MVATPHIFRMNIERIIIKVLLEAGDAGLSMSKISRHVLNAVNTLFEQQDYDAVHSEVKKYIMKNTGTSYSLFERTERRGTYRLNKKSSELAQLEIEF